MLKLKIKNLFSNFTGSFADAAVLFPLLVLMGQKTSFQFPMLFLSAGLLVIFSGYYFKVPMSVQPLKSIAIAAVAVGATAPEIQMSTLLLSLTFFILLISKAEKWLRYFSESWIHALQVALGVLLLKQGLDSVSKVSTDIFLLVALSVLLIYLIKKTDWPLLGIVATVALGYAIFSGIDWANYQTRSLDLTFGIRLNDIRWATVANLLLPQIVLTMANSVIATEYTCQYYFSKEHNATISKTVTKPRLMKTIIVSNFISAFVGGLPMCHGSGGVTALYKGGAKHWTSNLYLGIFLLGLTAVALFFDVQYLQFPKVIFGMLLVVVGVYHLVLAKKTWDTIEGKIRLLLAVGIVLLTRNLIFVLVSQMLISLLLTGYSKFKKNQNEAYT